MKSHWYKRILSRTSVIILSLFWFGFFTTTHAQPVTGVPQGGDTDIVITAHVVGCGDGMTQTSLGEQCDGTDLNNKTCADVGYSSGTLSCRNSCIFETNLCTHNTGGGSGSGSGTIRDPEDVFNENIPDTNIVFSGTGEPGSIFFVIADDTYFTSHTISDDGVFSTTVAEPESGDYEFTFYTISQNGLYGPRDFDIEILPYVTTYINNIFLPFRGVEDEVFEQIPENQFEETSSEEVTTTSGPVYIEGDVFEEFLQILGENENLSLRELKSFINAFAEQRGYSSHMPEYDLTWWQNTYQKVYTFTGGLTEWYPNVYLSFMVVYWNAIYDIDYWFNEYNAPFLIYTFFLPR